MTKLAILEEREEDKYDHETSLKCWRCNASEGAKVTSVLDEKVRLIPPPVYIVDINDVLAKR